MRKRCHNHKYDPFTQKEFHQVFAYFNNVPERGKAFKYGNSPPTIPAPTAEQESRMKAVDQKMTDAERHLVELEPKIAKAQREWEKSLTGNNDEVEGQGFGLYLKDGHLQANLVQRWLDDGARAERAKRQSS